MEDTVSILTRVQVEEAVIEGNRVWYITTIQTEMMNTLFDFLLTTTWNGTTRRKIKCFVLPYNITKLKT
jgi:hypothetical protein